MKILQKSFWKAIKYKWAGKPKASLIPIVLVDWCVVLVDWRVVSLLWISIIAKKLGDVTHYTKQPPPAQEEWLVPRCSYLLKHIMVNLDTLQKMTNSVLVKDDAPFDTKRLFTISFYASKIDLDRKYLHIYVHLYQNPLVD